jgi:hypothetical protein
VITTPVQYLDIPTVNDITITVPASDSTWEPRYAIYNYFYLTGVEAFTTTPVQNTGPISHTGLFILGGWVYNPGPGLQFVQPGWKVVNQPGWVVSAVDPDEQTITITGGKFEAGQWYSFSGTKPLNTTSIKLSVVPYNIYWVEIWLNGWRFLNTDHLKPRYIISGNGTIFFTEQVTGHIMVVIDTRPLQYFGANTAYSTQIQRDAFGPISLRSEPVILTQPRHGYVRLSADRKFLVYVPDPGFTGKDTYNWTLMTQNGQLGAAKCAQITVV